MKLDYLQFLELEVFTRFGARLEASMEATIRRGRVLRETLKQDRLSPLSANALLAWLIAFNEGYFDGMETEQVAGMVDGLAQHSQNIALTLNSPREQWLELIAEWLPRSETRAGS
jgi:F-type H+-transporting ATPase subunit alpha